MSTSELESLGVTRMTDAEVDGFLSSRGVGILGLPTEGVPYLVPLSFGFDGESALYFTYLVGDGSRKRELSDRTDRARFLVYDTTSKFAWQSVVLTGRLERVPESEWDGLDEAMENAWHPDVFESADLTGGVQVYRFTVEEEVGLKQTGLPPGFRQEE